MISRRLLIVAILAIVAAMGLGSARATAQEISVSFKGYALEGYVHPTTVTPSEALALVQNGQVRPYNAWDLLHHVGRSDSTAFIEPLKELAAELTMADSTRTTGFNALYALRMLGVPKSYFLENVATHQQNPWLAAYSIDVLAYDPDSETLDLLQSLWHESSSNLVKGALSGYQALVFAAGRYDETELPADKAHFLVHESRIGRGLTPWGFEAGNPQSGLHPFAVWARLRLRELYQEHPTVVEQEIAAVQPEQDASDPHLVGKLRTLLTHVVTADASEFPEPFNDDAEEIPDLPGAVTIASGAASASFGGRSFMVSGVDLTVAGEVSGVGADVHGIFAASPKVVESLLDALADNQEGRIVGAGPAPDVTHGILEFDPAALIDVLMTIVTDTLTPAHSGSLGTIEDPVVAYAPNGLTLSGNVTGTGVLVIDGRFEQRGGADWIGLVAVRSGVDAPPVFELRGEVEVTGAVLLYNETDGAARLEISGGANVRYSREAFDVLRSALFPTPRQKCNSR